MQRGVVSFEELRPNDESGLLTPFDDFEKPRRSPATVSPRSPKPRNARTPGTSEQINTLLAQAGQVLTGLKMSGAESNLAPNSNSKSSNTASSATLKRLLDESQTHLMNLRRRQSNHSESFGRAAGVSPRPLSPIKRSLSPSAIISPSRAHARLEVIQQREKKEDLMRTLTDLTQMLQEEQKFENSQKSPRRNPFVSPPRRPTTTDKEATTNMQSKLHELESRVDALRREKSVLEAQHSAVIKMNESLTEENEALQRATHRSSRIEEQLAKRGEEVRLLKEELTRKTTELMAAKEQSQSALMQQEQRYVAMLRDQEKRGQQREKEMDLMVQSLESQLSKDTDTKSQTITELTALLNHLNVERKADKAEIAQLKTDFHQQSLNLSTLVSEVEELRGQRNQFEVEASDAKRALASALARRVDEDVARQREEHVSLLQGQLRSLTAKSDEQHNQIRMVTAKCDGLQRDLDDRERAMETLQTSYEEAMQKAEFLNKKCIEGEERIAGLMEDLQAAEQRARDMALWQTTSMNQLEDREKEYQALRGDCDNTAALLEQNLAHISELQRAKEESDAKVAKAQRDQQMLVDQIQRLVASVEEEKSAHFSEIQEMSTELEQTAAVLSQVRGELKKKDAMLKSSLENSTVAVEECKAELNSAQIKNESLDAALAEATEEIGTLNQNIRKLETALSVKTSQMDAQTIVIETMRREVEKDKSELSQDRKTERDKIAKFAAELAKVNEEARSLKQENQRLIQKVREVESAASATHDNEHRKLQIEYQSLLQRAADMESSVNTAHGTVASACLTIEELRTQITQLERQLADERGHRQLAQHHSKISDANFNEVSADLRQLQQEKIDLLRLNVPNIETHFSDDVKSPEAHIQHMQKELASVRTSLKKDADHIESDLRRLATGHGTPSAPATTSTNAKRTLEFPTPRAESPPNSETFIYL